jgi:hypothetical protein
MITLLIAVFITGWAAAAILGTQAYFLGEQTKPIHERNLKSQSFEQLAKAVTGKETNHAERIPAYAMDTYASQTLSNG